MTESPFKMRACCKHCGSEAGRIETRGGQDCVFCAACGRYAGYNAPKTETGRAVRTVETVHNGIKPKIRARILELDNGRCVQCGKDASRAVLHIGHVISVKEGLSAGLTEAQLNHDENLVTLCDECNLGVGSEPMSLRFLIRVLHARLNFKARAACP